MSYREPGLSREVMRESTPSLLRRALAFISVDFVLAVIFGVVMLTLFVLVVLYVAPYF